MLCILTGTTTPVLGLEKADHDNCMFRLQTISPNRMTMYYYHIKRQSVFQRLACSSESQRLNVFLWTYTLDALVSCIFTDQKEWVLHIGENVLDTRCPWLVRYLVSLYIETLYT
jgi:hypothetical protein